MDFWDYEYLNIPINYDGVRELDSSSDSKWCNVYSIKLTKEDVNNVFRLFLAFNSAFGIIIDIAEEERILNPDLTEALSIARKYYDDATDDVKPSVKKVIDAINAALKYNTFVEFDL